MQERLGKVHSLDIQGILQVQPERYLIIGADIEKRCYSAQYFTAQQ